MNGLRLALGFLTILPVRPKDRMETGDLGQAAIWYPLVGMLIGGAVWGLYEILQLVFPGPLAAALTVAGWVLLTGGLHLDGLADSCDGLFVSASPQRRLEILRDTGVGAFGVVGVSLLLILKVAAVASLLDSQGLILAAIVGRWIMLPLARTPAARAEGLGATLRDELTVPRLFLPLLVTVAVSLALGLRGVLALVAVHAVAIGFGLFARARIGGHTGDVLGAACELGELTCLLVFAVG